MRVPISVDLDLVIITNLANELHRIHLTITAYALMFGLPGIHDNHRRASSRGQGWPSSCGAWAAKWISAKILGGCWLTTVYARSG